MLDRIEPAGIFAPDPAWMMAAQRARIRSCTRPGLGENGQATRAWRAPPDGSGQKKRDRNREHFDAIEIAGKAPDRALDIGGIDRAAEGLIADALIAEFGLDPILEILAIVGRLMA
jgi:hypothetical protein